MLPKSEITLSERISNIYGLDMDINDYGATISEINWFFQLRKQLEKEKSSLLLSTPDSLRKTRRLSCLQDNVLALIDGKELETKLLCPLLDGDIANKSEAHFLFACIVLSNDRKKQLFDHGLAKIFPQLLVQIVKELTIPEMSLKSLRTNVTIVCKEDNTS
jgi:hypothetical protein